MCYLDDNLGEGWNLHINIRVRDWKGLDDACGFFFLINPTGKRDLFLFYVSLLRIGGWRA